MTRVTASDMILILFRPETGRRFRHLVELDNDHGHIIRSATLERELDQTGAALLRRLVSDRAADLIIGHMCRQTVAADYEHVAGMDLPMRDVERRVVHR